MRFNLVDRVVELQPGSRIVATKTLSMAEEYLADHFPRFPVMPGVLMLEALTQAAAMLVRVTDDFAHSVITLKEARNVKYADFVQPGATLVVTAEITNRDESGVHLKARGVVDGRVAVSGRLLLERSNLADTRPELAANDAYLKQSMRELLALLWRPLVQAVASG